MKRNKTQGKTLFPLTVKNLAGDSISSFLNGVNIVPHNWRSYADQRGISVTDRILGDYEIILVREGRVRCLLDDREVILRVGQGLLIPPYLPHSIYSFKDVPFVNGWVHFGVFPLYRRTILNGLCRCREGRVSSLTPLMEHMGREWLDSEGLSGGGLWFGVKSLIQSYLWQQALGSEEREGLEPPVSSALSLCLDVMERDYRENIGTDEIARRAGLGRTKLFSLFKEELKCSPGDFLETLRLQEAERLLKTTGLSVKEIGYEAGFSSPVVFHRNFQKRYATTPGGFREDYRELTRSSVSGGRNTSSSLSRKE